MRLAFSNALPALCAAVSGYWMTSKSGQVSGPRALLRSRFAARGMTGLLNRGAMASANLASAIRAGSAACLKDGQDGHALPSD
jgi:hypothetical protein